MSTNTTIDDAVSNSGSSKQDPPCNPTEDVLKELNLIWTPPVNDDGTIVFDCAGKFQYFQNNTFTLEDLASENFELAVATRQTRTCSKGLTPQLSSPLKKCDVETVTGVTDDDDEWTYGGQMKNGKHHG
eukprot:798718_1